VIADLLLRALKAKQVELAQTALGNPRGTDSYEYGRVVGLYAGLQVALDEIENILAEDDVRTRDL
jgi:hypothetical protein